MNENTKQPGKGASAQDAKHENAADKTLNHAAAGSGKSLGNHAVQAANPAAPAPAKARAGRDDINDDADSVARAHTAQADAAQDQAVTGQGGSLDGMQLAQLDPAAGEAASTCAVGETAAAAGDAAAAAGTFSVGPLLGALGALGLAAAGGRGGGDSQPLKSTCPPQPRSPSRRPWRLPAIPAHRAATISPALAR